MVSESPRRHARELVLQALYAVDCGNGQPEESLSGLLATESLSEKNAAFARQLFATVWRRREWADEQIKRLSTNWDISRVASIDRAILRMAVVELTEMPDVPVNVVLNEAIELAKKFSTRESSRFVNGILDSFVAQLRSR